MLEKFRRVVPVVSLVHLAGGFVTIVLLSLASPIVIGDGQFESIVGRLENFDFKWWLVSIVTFLWTLPIFLVVIYRLAKAAGLEVGQLRDEIRRTARGLLENRTIPVQVDIEDRVPVCVDEPLSVPVELSTTIDIDEDIDIEAEIPVQTRIPIDTYVETSVLSLGTIKIPIKASIPVDTKIAIRGRIGIKAKGIAIDIRENATVRLPQFDLPIKCRIETKIDLLTNFEAAESFLTKGE